MSEGQRGRERAHPGMQKAECSEIRVNVSPHPLLHPSRLALSFFLPPSIPPSLLLLRLPVLFEGWIITAALRFPPSFFKAQNGDGEGLPGPGCVCRCACTLTHARTHTQSADTHSITHRCTHTLSCSHCLPGAGKSDLLQRKAGGSDAVGSPY